MCEAAQSQQSNIDILIERAHPFLGAVESFVADKNQYIRLLQAALPDGNGLRDQFHGGFQGYYFYLMIYQSLDNANGVTVRLNSTLPWNNRSPDLREMTIFVSLKPPVEQRKFDTLYCWATSVDHIMGESPIGEKRRYTHLDTPRLPQLEIELNGQGDSTVALREWLDNVFKTCFPHYVPVVPVKRPDKIEASPL